ncbi:hypothetical protein BDI4_380109 [Burkholderia diffusa]|nr:hypothetical protein BDI4_380109 [Burkholderia diffusa]
MRASCVVDAEVEIVAHRVAHQRGFVRQLHLLEDARLVGADRFRAQREVRRDPRDRLARDDAAHHVEFALGQPLVRQHFGRRAHRAREAFGRRRAHVHAAGRDLGDGLDELGGRAVLRQVAGRAGLERARRVLRFRVHRQHQHAQRWRLCLDQPDQLDTGRRGHRQVEQQHVGGATLGQRERGRAVARLADDLETAGRFQDVTQSVSHDCVIVSQNYPDHLAVLFGMTPRAAVPVVAAAVLLTNICRRNGKWCTSGTFLRHLGIECVLKRNNRREMGRAVGAGGEGIPEESSRSGGRRASRTTLIRR